MTKKPFACRLRTDTIKIIKRRAKDIGGSQADVIENWAHGRTVVYAAPAAETSTTTVPASVTLSPIPPHPFQL